MMTSESEDPRRRAVGADTRHPRGASLPIFGVLDLHAILTPKMDAPSDGLVSYRECPHTDSRESAMRTAELLTRCLKTGVHPPAYFAAIRQLIASHTDTNA